MLGWLDSLCSPEADVKYHLISLSVAKTRLRKKHPHRRTARLNIEFSVSVFVEKLLL